MVSNCVEVGVGTVFVLEQSPCLASDERREPGADVVVVGRDVPLFGEVCAFFLSEVREQATGPAGVHRLPRAYVRATRQNEMDVRHRHGRLSP